MAPRRTNMPQTAEQQTQRELAVLRLLHEKETVPQRDIARHTGMSLGLTNAVLKRLARKGYVTMRKATGRNMAYAVTPDGVNEIAKRTYRYFRRTMSHVAEYKERIDQLVAGAAAGGYHTLVLIGKSDLDFLVEHACAREGLTFEHRKKEDLESHVLTGVFRVLAEGAPENSREGEDNLRADARLWNVIL